MSAAELECAMSIAANPRLVGSGATAATLARETADKEESRGLRRGPGWRERGDREVLVTKALSVLLR